MAASASLAFRILATENTRAAFRVTADGAEQVDKKLGLLGRTASKAGQVVKGALVTGLAAGFAAASVAIVKGIKDAADYNTLAAKTAAVLKSTGNAAGTTVKHVQDLAGQLESLSGVDETLIINGENVLATFTGIGNRAGKNNDIFDQATKAALNLSVALGTDMQGASILVGKALNDPIKGLTALGRAGVSFTEQQKQQITQMVKSGDTMGAQKIILKELTTEFGGAAAAAGKGFTGALARAQDAVGDFFRGVGQLALPALSGFADLVGTKVVPGMADFVAGVQAGSDAAVETGNSFTHLGVLARSTFEGLMDAAQRVVEPVMDVGHAMEQILVPVLRDAGTVAKPLAEILGGSLLFGLHALADILSFLGEHAEVFALIATGVLAYAAAMKAAVAATAAAKAVYEAVTKAYEVMALRAMYAAEGNLVAATGMNAAKLAAAGFAGVIGIATVALLIWAKRHAEAKARMDELKSAIDADSGALGKNTRAVVSNRLEHDGLLTAAQKVGVSLSLVTDAALGNEDAMRRLRAALLPYNGAAAAAGQVTSEQAAAASILLQGLDQLPTEVGAAAEASKRQAAAATESKTATEGQATAIGKAKDAAAQAKLKMDALYDSLTKLAGGNLTVLESQIRIADNTRELAHSLDGLDAAQRRNTRSLGLNTEEGSKARGQLITNIQAILDNGDALKAQGKSTDQVRASIATQIGTLRAHYLQLGYNKGQVDNIIAALGALGKQAPKPKVTINTGQATTAIDTLNRKLTTIDGRKVSTYVYNFQQDITRPAVGKIGNAGGGFISGPGTATSDSITRALSNGEYVVKASMVTKLGRGFFDQINYGGVTPSGGGGRPGNVYNINVNVSASPGTHPAEIGADIFRSLKEYLRRQPGATL